MKLNIESIEGGTYLATWADQEQRNLVRDCANKLMIFHCLNKIKEHFKHKPF